MPTLQLPVTRIVETNNHDVASLMRRLDRLLIELTKSASSNVSALMVYDLARVRGHLKMLKSFKLWAAKQPHMDAPESNPVTVKVECFGKVLNVDNDSVWDLSQLIDTAILELASSVSSRLSANMLPHDSDRFDSYVARIEDLLAHIEASEPTDNPESMPRDQNSGEGISGIKTVSGNDR
jgi:hypothetical protein